MVQLTVAESGFEIGDILSGQTHMYRTMTYWYKVIGSTQKRLKLIRLPVCYPTKYCSNTPGDKCMPVIDGHCPAGFPYRDMDDGGDECNAMITKYRDTYYAEILGDHYGPLLTKWNGKPGWVNCD